VVLREPDIRIAAGDHLRNIPMRDAEAPREVLHFFGKEGVGRGLTDQRFDCGAVADSRVGFDRIGLSEACARARHVSKTVNSEWIAPADE